MFQWKYLKLTGLHYENTEYLENSDNGSDTDFEPYKSDKYSKESFSCDICSKIFAKKSKLERHIETHGSKKAFSCQEWWLFIKITKFIRKIC